jgi:hypothetical protein
MKTYSFLFLLLLCVVLSSCDDKDTGTTPPPANQTPTLPVRLIRDIQADTSSTGRVTYFSLRDSAIVTGADTASNKWDIAFRTTTILVNGGSGRFGQGGAIVMTSTDFDTLSQVPTAGWRTDTTSAFAIPTGAGNGWYNYNSTTNVISPIPGVVIALRTADGRFAKVQLLSYYRGAPQNPDGFRDRSRVYTFRYVFQPDATRRVK